MIKQLEIKGFERTEKPEPKNMNDKAKNIFLGILEHNQNLIKQSK